MSDLLANAAPSAAVLVHATQLRQQLLAHQHAYHVLDEPTVPDAEYDKLFAQL